MAVRDPRRRSGVRPAARGPARPVRGDRRQGEPPQRPTLDVTGSVGVPGRPPPDEGRVSTLNRVAAAADTRRSESCRPSKEAAFAPPPGTARLNLREFIAGDVDAIHALDSDPRVMRFIGDGSTSTREDAALAIGRVQRRYIEHPGQGVWHASRRDDGRFVGWVSLKFAGESPDVEVGYRLVCDAWGSGFATELARVMLERGFDTLYLDRIIGVTHPDNHASQRVLAKVGMRDEGWGRYYEHDLRLFAIDREGWAAAARFGGAR